MYINCYQKLRHFHNGELTYVYGLRDSIWTREYKKHTDQVCWIWIDEIRKLVFIRALKVKEEDSLYIEVLESIACKCHYTIGEGMSNKHDSPIFDILKVAISYGLYEEVNIIINGHFWN